MQTKSVDSEFPVQRPRRLRRGQTVRNALADVRLTRHDLVYPLFVGDLAAPEPIDSMPGISRLPVLDAVETIGQLAKAGLQQFMLFGVTNPTKKNAQGAYAADADAPVNRVMATVRDRGVEAWMFADLCLCEYTDHGHCGVLCQDDPKWVVNNDATVQQLGKVAQVLAASGADVVAPSGMMDGQVAAVRRALDDAGYAHVAILSYSVKYASSLYGPFREAGGGEMSFGDRRGYQMDYRRQREWQTEVDADVAEGADMVMVKPAVAYLDIVRQVRDRCHVPVAAYHVSGECAMLWAAAQRGWVDLQPAALEITSGIKRAGADLIVTYLAPQLLEWIDTD